jgi:hypothetical protein
LHQSQFANADDIKHIMHALKMLKPGGRLVAICANGPRQNDQLRPIVKARGGIWEELPSDTFISTGTSVPAGVTLPNAVLAADVIASLIRMSGGNFRLLTRLLTQIERILKVNNLDTVSKEIVAAARDSLVIGQV